MPRELEGPLNWSSFTINKACLLEVDIKHGKSRVDWSILKINVISSSYRRPYWWGEVVNLF